MRRFIGLCLIILTALAQNTSAEPLPIGMAPFPPFKYVEGTEILGSDTEIVQHVFKRMGEPIEIVVEPWKRVQAMAKVGKYAAIYSFTKNAQREKNYIFSDPLSTVQDVFFKRKENDIEWQTLSDLVLYRVGYGDGYNYARDFMDALNAAQFALQLGIVHAEPEKQGLRMLKQNRIDLLICEISVCSYLITNHAPTFDGIDFINTPVGAVRIFHAGFPRSWPDAERLAERFNRALAELVASGERKRILEKYGVVSPLL